MFSIQHHIHFHLYTVYFNHLIKIKKYLLEMQKNMFYMHFFLLCLDERWFHGTYFAHS